MEEDGFPSREELEMRLLHAGSLSWPKGVSAYDVDLTVALGVDPGNSSRFGASAAG